MPFVFAIAGVLLLISGVRGTVTGTNPNLVSLLKSDFTGSPNFLEWMLAIFVIGAVGYINGFKELSRAFMALVVIGLIVSNKGFFADLVSEVKSTDSSVQATATPNVESGTSTPSTSSKATSSSSILDNLQDYLQDEFETTD